MSIPYKHHFIPVCYLQHWCSYKDGKLYEFSIKHGKFISKRVGPRRTGFQENLYSFPELPTDAAQHLTRLRLRPTRCISWRGWCKWTPVEPAGTCPGYKSSKLDGSEDPWTTGARDEHTAIGGGSVA